MNETTLDEEARLKTLVKDYFGEFVTARKTIEELDGTLSDNKFFTKDGNLVLEGVNLNERTHIQLVNETEELTEELIAPLQQNREVDVSDLIETRKCTRCRTRSRCLCSTAPCIRPSTTWSATFRTSNGTVF